MDASPTTEPDAYPDDPPAIPQTLLATILAPITAALLLALLGSYCYLEHKGRRVMAQIRETRGSRNGEVLLPDEDGSECRS
ncbi:MAG: hypothetical protein WDW36_009971 [Sanguina aurantia]